MKRKPRPNGTFLTLRDAEREYGLAYHMLYAWVNEGRIPHLAAAGRHVILIKRVDLDAFLNANMATVRS